MDSEKSLWKVCRLIANTGHIEKQMYSTELESRQRQKLINWFGKFLFFKAFMKSHQKKRNCPIKCHFILLRVERKTLT